MPTENAVRREKRNLYGERGGEGRVEEGRGGEGKQAAIISKVAHRVGN